MSIHDLTQVYLIGIGGIGMSALARYFVAAGKTVAGFDRTPSDLTKALEKEGIDIHYRDDIAFIPPDFKKKSLKDSTLVIFTPAISNSHSELIYFMKNGYSIYKRAHALGLIAKDKDTIAIAGTHGKTTTTTLVAHILKTAGKQTLAFLGGISKNYDTNLLLTKRKTDYIVAEADEYDRSFLSLYPQIAVVTAVDADHLDIFGSLAEVKKSFTDFVDQIKKDGVLIYKKGIDLKVHNKQIKTFTYSITDKTADFYADKIKVKDGLYVFDFVSAKKSIDSLELGLPGRINVENAVGAIAASLFAGAGVRDIRKAVKSYQGVKRRFDVILKTKDLIMIDDYAHHPVELKASIESIRELFPKKRITGIFQPHLYSRTRDFADDFAASLDLLDECIVLDIYPAREVAIPGVTSEMIIRRMKIKSKYTCTKNDVLKCVLKLKPELLVTFGAGNIDKISKPIKQQFEKQTGK